MYIEKLENEKILITGATGLIGQTIIKMILEYNNRYKDSRIHLIAVVRNKDYAIKLFDDKYNSIEYVVGDIRSIDLSNVQYTYVIHAASNTSSNSFVNEPLEVISVAVDGTRHLFEEIKRENIKKIIYLSTMEVYGILETDELIGENHFTSLQTNELRSCYPESKRMCENICASYGYKYGINYNILRLTQTFGEGVSYADKRIFAEFARCVMEKRNIVLKTKGETRRSYLYTGDAVDAIFRVMLEAPNGEIYNVANENTYCSIFEMAKLVASDIANGDIEVKIQEDDINKLGFAPTLHINLDTSKIRKLGWKPEVGLKEMYERTIKFMKCEA